MTESFCAIPAASERCRGVFDGQGCAPLVGPDCRCGAAGGGENPPVRPVSRRARDVPGVSASVREDRRSLRRPEATASPSSRSGRGRTEGSTAEKGRSAGDRLGDRVAERPHPGAVVHASASRSLVCARCPILATVSVLAAASGQRSTLRTRVRGRDDGR